MWPLSRLAFQLSVRESAYTTLLMSTGLTFGTISALFGLTNHIISQTQYTILVTVVILSAVLLTLIAQTFFRPAVPLRTEAQGTAGQIRGLGHLQLHLAGQGQARVPEGQLARYGLAGPDAVPAATAGALVLIDHAPAPAGHLLAAVQQQAQPKAVPGVVRGDGG